MYDELYKGTSGREIGTLFHLKNYFNHRNVTNNIKESFNHGEEFLEFCTDGFIILLALHLLKLNNVNDIPEDFPDNKNDKILYLERTSTNIMDMIFVSSRETVNKILNIQEEVPNDEYDECICKREIPGANMIFCDNRKCPRGVWFHLECLDMEEDDVPDGKWFCSDTCKMSKGLKRPQKTKTVEAFIDAKKDYTLRVMWRGLNQKVRRDAIRENDGNRMILHWKLDMLQFFEKHHPKYFLIGQRLLSAINGAVSPRLCHTLIWNRTVNPNGGKGKNIAMDLQMEFFNKEYKGNMIILNLI